MTGFPLLTLSILIPFLASFIALKTRDGKKLSLLASITLLLPSLAAMHVYYRSGSSGAVFDPPIARLAGVGSISFFVDGLSLPVVLGASLVSAIVALYSLPYMVKRVEEMGLSQEEHIPKYFALYLVFAGSMIGVTLTNNLIVFYLFLELSLISSFLLINWYGYGDRKRIAILYFVWTHIGAAFFLLGALVYGVIVGTFDFYHPEKGPMLGWASSILTPFLSKLVLYTILFGLLVKMAVLGVHFWLPYAHAEAPTPISALLSPVLIGLGGYGVARILLTLYQGLPQGLQVFLIALALATMLYGGFNALKENDIKRILAYSSVSQMGYVLLGIATLVPVGIAGSIFHILAHSFGKALLFMAAGSIIYYYETRQVNRLGGLAQLVPITASAALVGFLVITGVPPTIGFWSEVMIIGGYSGYLMEAGSLSIPLLVFVSGIGLSIAYSFITMKKVFFGQKKQEFTQGDTDKMLSSSLVIAIILSIGLFLLFGYMAPGTLDSVNMILGGG